MRDFMADFCGGFADQKQDAAAIRKLYEDTGYVIDTHTGVALAAAQAYRQETGDGAPMVIAATASPYKFAGSVLEAIEGTAPEGDAFAAADRLSRISGDAGAGSGGRSAPQPHPPYPGMRGIGDGRRGKGNPESLRNQVFAFQNPGYGVY